MLRSLYRPISQTLCVLCMCLALVACNEEKEKKVLAQTDEAMRTVQAQKAAADMANTAQQLLAAPTTAPLTGPELRTVVCGNNKIVAYFPKTSSLATNNSIPGNIAERVKVDLTQRFKPENIVTSATVDASCGTLTDIATNSPVLQLDNNFAAQTAVSTDQSEVSSIQMASCGLDANGKRIPGVITTKSFKDGRPNEVQQSCGASAPSTLDQLVLTNADLPDWKARLLGNATANQRILCIQGSQNCTPIPDGDMGTQVVCNNAATKEELVVNPKFNAAIAKFEPSATPQDCGKGWKGEMIANIKTKQCNVIRSGQVQSLPATVVDVAYVGAKCKKSNVDIVKSCPAGTPFGNTGGLMEGSNQIMTAPLALEAKKVNGVNVSSVAYKRTENNQVVTNASTYTTGTLIPTAQNLITANGPRSEQFFLGLTDTSVVGPNDFDQTFVDEMTVLNKIGPEPGSVTCYAKAQSCMVDFTPTSIDVTVDRSQKMNDMAIVPIYATRTACQATLANLFVPAQRHDACQAAKAWKTLAQQYHVTDAALNNWDYHVEPVQQGHQILHNELQALDPAAADALNNYRITMVQALKSPSLYNRLDYAILIGQDCNPPTTPDGMNIRTQEDMYGTCAPQYVANDQIASLFGVDTANPYGKVLKTCQTGCPGECVTNVERYAASDATPYAPKPTMMTKMQAIDHYVQNSLIPRLPMNARTVYGEMLSGSVDNLGQTNPGRRPIVLQENLSQTVTDLANVNMSFYWANAADKLRTKRAQSGANVDGIPKIYESLDVAIDRLRLGKTGTKLKGDTVSGTVSTDGLDSNPNVRTSMIVFGSKFDADCIDTLSWWESLFDSIAGWFGAGLSQTLDRDTWAQYSDDKCKTFRQSPYYSRNFCEPERVPSGYQCNYCRRTILGICVTRKNVAININEVKSTYGVDGWHSREQWCQAKGYGNKLEVQATYSGPEVYDNVNSFIGFMHRNFPNTRLYYFDADGNGLSSWCYNEINYDKKKPHVFVGNDFPPKKGLTIFNAKNDIGASLNDSINQSTGGGAATDEAGKYVCEQKYGANSIISYGAAPKPLPPRTQTFNQISTGTCDPLVTLDPNLPPNMPQPPPLPPVPSPTLPPNSGYNGNGNNGPQNTLDPCVNGFTTYTMQAC